MISNSIQVVLPTKEGRMDKPIAIGFSVLERRFAKNFKQMFNIFISKRFTANSSWPNFGTGLFFPFLERKMSRSCIQVSFLCAGR